MLYCSPTITSARASSSADANVIELGVSSQQVHLSERLNSGPDYGPQAQVSITNAEAIETELSIHQTLASESAGKRPAHELSITDIQVHAIAPGLSTRQVQESNGLPSSSVDELPIPSTSNIRRRPDHPASVGSNRLENVTILNNIARRNGFHQTISWVRTSFSLSLK